METNSIEDISRIIAAYLGGTASEEDTDFLKNWVESSDENRRFYLKMKNIWDVSNPGTDPETISSNIALAKVLKQINRDKAESPFWRYLQKVAAILLLPLLLAIIVQFIVQKQSKNQPETYSEIQSAPGTRQQITLSDSSRVWLNSGSVLRYPLKFSGTKRLVYLKGEAYFEVESDKSRPFTVQTSSVNVTATGTCFNVLAFEGEKNIEITLVKGKVDVFQNNKRNMNIASMEAGQHLTYNSNNQSSNLLSCDTYRYVSWKDGKLIFRNQPLNEVVKRIGQTYNMDIELQGEELQEYRYRATFENESPDEILKLLTYSSPVAYKEIKRDPLPDGSFPRRKIIIYPVKRNK
jgi:transmembrane sensor